MRTQFYLEDRQNNSILIEEETHDEVSIHILAGDNEELYDLGTLSLGDVKHIARCLLSFCNMKENDPYYDEDEDNL
jgi:hypothetical protein